MTRFTLFCRFAAMLTLAGLAARLEAAELRLKSDCQVDGGVVRLGDLAEIFSSDAGQAKRLAEIDLMPMPAAGQKRIVRAREVQDMLALRGVNLVEHRLSGASQVTIAAPKDEGAAVAPGKNYSQQARKAPAVVRDALVQYLNDRSTVRQEWQIQVELDDEQTQAVAATRQPLVVEGGASPWTGLQQFVVSCNVATGVVRIPVAAQVSLPPTVVVAVQALARGTLIRPGDVRLQPGNPTEGSVRVFQAIEDVIGKETTRVITPGQILDDQLVVAPVLVRRGEIVTVYARSAGIQVRTTARARDDGSQGELVTVESIDNRKPFFARVTGPQQVEVFAQSPQIAAEPAALPPARQAARPIPRPAAVTQQTPNTERGGTVVRFNQPQQSGVAR